LVTVPTHWHYSTVSCVWTVRSASAFDPSKFSQAFSNRGWRWG